MKVQIVREKSFAVVGSQGPFTRVFAIGDIIDLDEVHAQMLIAEGTAKHSADKPAKPAAEKAVKPAAKSSKK